jgi:hypothetical protein
MGNRFICMTKKESKDVGSRSKRIGRSQRKLVTEEELHLQALSMALQQHQLSQRFEGSMSRRIGSTSSRRRTLPDSVPLNNNNKQVLLFFENFWMIIIIHSKVFIFQSFNQGCLYFFKILKLSWFHKLFNCK